MGADGVWGHRSCPKPLEPVNTGMCQEPGFMETCWESVAMEASQHQMGLEPGFIGAQSHRRCWGYQSPLRLGELRACVCWCLS